MRKLIAITAVAGLLAAGACSSRENRGGTSDNQNNPTFDNSAGSTGKGMDNTTTNAPSTNPSGNSSGSQGGTGSSSDTSGSSSGSDNSSGSK